MLFSYFCVPICIFFFSIANTFFFYLKLTVRSFQPLVFFLLLQKSAPKPMQAPQGYSPYGTGAPSSMYMGGVQPYGSSLFNGTSMPPYEAPYPGSSAYHYNYGTRISGGSPYRPMHLSAPAPYSTGSMMGNGLLLLFCFVFSCLHCWFPPCFIYFLHILYGNLFLLVSIPHLVLPCPY